MCLAIPMVVTRVDEDGNGEVELDGARYHVNLSLLESPAKGDYVIVHAGFAIEKLDRTDADQRLQLFSELAASRQSKEPTR